MFTGLIQTIGTVSAVNVHGTDLILQIALKSAKPFKWAVGDSIAVNGVCLTVTQAKDEHLNFDVSLETINTTSLQYLTTGRLVNLEPAMQLSDRLGGHIVSGHVDGLAELTSIRDEGRSRRLTYRLIDPGLGRYIASKGSVAIDGVSLTVNEVDQATFGVNIIPHTWDHTVMRDYQSGQIVNIEVDVIARYVERMLDASSDQGRASSLNMDQLSQL